MSEIKLTVRPFKMGTDKEAALKPLEEASEVRAAWQKIDECGIPEQCRDCDLHSTCEAIFALADEIADTIQASCNLAARYDIDLQAAMERCEKRNRARGRYPMEDEDAKPCGIYDGDNRGCGGDCGAVPVGVGYLREKSPEEMSEREAVIERLRKIDFAQGKVTLYKIAVAILGDEPAPASWWSDESRAALRDKLIELLSYEKVPDGE